MIKICCYITALLTFMEFLHGQKITTFQDSVSTYFNEIKVQIKKHQNVWIKDLYKPILIVNPTTRQLYANYPDTAGVLKNVGNIFTGVLPNEINIANTAIDWNGRRWAMIMLPLPVNKQDRINLLAHELFHVNQPSLGFQLFNVDNNHLDHKDGRVYLRLELEALRKLIQANDRREQKMHLTNAISFRKYRYLLYAGADTTENLLELNEGIAEYTGVVISARSKKQSIEHFVQSMNSFLSNPTFVRSFAYQTTPVYGYVLGITNKGWNREISIKTNLTDYFIKALGITLPNNLKKSVDLASNLYNGDLILAEETTREEITKKRIIEYKSKFIEQPHLEIMFEKMQVAFTPGNIMPLDTMGTVYPNIRVSDNWGILTVKNGALLGSNWDKISITVPLKYENKNISGDGWTLELRDGYVVAKDAATGNYKLTIK